MCFFRTGDVACIGRDQRSVEERANRECFRFDPGFFEQVVLETSFYPVANLELLNGFVLYRHFKIEGMHTLMDSLLQGDWIVKIDLKDAYLLVLIHPNHRWLLQFRWHVRKCEFKVSRSDSHRHIDSYKAPKTGIGIVEILGHWDNCVFG